MIIAVTMGDPFGIGPEIILKSLSDDDIRKRAGYLILGSRQAIEWNATRLGIPWEGKAIDEPGHAVAGEISIFDDGKFEWHKGSIGKSTRGGGAASGRWIIQATELSLSHTCNAMVTAPISKEALWKSGHKFQGHTEFLAHMTDAPRAVMMLVGEGLRVALVTTHTALKDVPSLITKANVLVTILITNTALADLMGMERPRIGVCALNPHAGEGGLFGDEESREIAPAIDQARDRGVDCTGPFPADTLLYKAWKGEFDAVVAMYHDQGLVSLKLIAFETGVNVTLGLPIIRTSPDHGTAYDIAGKGIADPRSMKEAIKLAVDMASRKSRSGEKEK